jgi:uncharacterized protein YbjT (DUF2867 family)
MILVAGGTGTLGTRVVDRLHARGLPVRILARGGAASRAGAAMSIGVELVEGDVRDSDSVRRAMNGVTAVVSAVHGFVGPRGVSPRTIDRDGNRNMVRAAASAGVERFVLLSIHGAATDHPLELFRMKHEAEGSLVSSGVPWTILRPSAYLETWIPLLCGPLARSGATRVFGTGRNPINFVSAEDVAAFVELAVTEAPMAGLRLDIPGPQNPTMVELIESFQAATGIAGSVKHIPRTALRLMAVAARPLNPALARQAATARYMDTRDMRGDAAERARRYPELPVTRPAAVVAAMAPRLVGQTV